MSDESALIAFVKARLDEREKTARAAMHGKLGDWELRDDIHGDTNVRVSLIGPDIFRLGATGWPGVQEVGRHIVSNDPAGILADIASIRKMLDWLERTRDWAADNNLWTYDAVEPFRILAEPYKNHPEYPQEQA